MKNADKLLDLIGELDEEMIPEMPLKGEGAKLEVKKKTGKNRKILWIELGIAAAAVILAISIALPKVLYKKKGKNSDAKILLAEPVYPEMAQHPDFDKEDYLNGAEARDIYNTEMKKWREGRAELANQPEGYRDGYEAFLKDSTGTFMAEAGDTENFAYSPLSLYLSMSMVAETADGNTREQILKVLGVPDLDTLRANVKALFLANYVDDGFAKCLPANSLWLSDRFEYKNDTVERLATEYFGSVFSGDPEDEKYEEEFRKWINRQTDGLLSDYTSDMKMDPNMLYMIASTINYSGKWFFSFQKVNTKEGVFHANSGDITCDFMNMEYEELNCIADEGYTAVELPLDGNGKMRLILPDEGYSVRDLLEDEKFMELLNDPTNGYGAMVDLSLPKFDVGYKNDMIDELKKLGITDAFDECKGDFSSIVDQGPNDQFFVKKVEQDVRVMIDEEGCKAAAVTTWAAVGQCAPSDHYHLIFDRPFIFEIFSETGALLFVGVVNDPTA